MADEKRLRIFLDANILIRGTILRRWCSLRHGFVADTLGLALPQGLRSVLGQESLITGRMHGQTKGDVLAGFQTLASALRGLGEPPDDLTVLSGGRV